MQGVAVANVAQGSLVRAFYLTDGVGKLVHPWRPAGGNGFYTHNVTAPRTGNP